MWPQFTPSDTYAAWAVAVFTVIGTAISAWAVYLVRDTLEANRAAVSVAREIGEAQVQAYLYFQKVEAIVPEITKNILCIDVYIGNSGQSPCRDLVMVISATVVIMLNEGTLHPFEFRPKTIMMPDIIASGGSSYRVAFLETPLSMEHLDDVVSIQTSIKITGQSVFGRNVDGAIECGCAWGAAKQVVKGTLTELPILGMRAPSYERQENRSSRDKGRRRH